MPSIKRTTAIAAVVLIAAGATAGGVYIAGQAVADQTTIRCFPAPELEADDALSLAHPRNRPPAEAVEHCADQWRNGTLTRDGINPEALDPDSDFDPEDTTITFSVPELSACVYEDEVGVFPGSSRVCQRLGLKLLAE
jgi:hypothetical protein